jgi:hypothetical protein
VASKKSLNAKNLEALGSTRLSELMIEITKNDIEAKRFLRLELAGEQGSEVAAPEIRKRLTTIAGSSSFVEWDQIKKLIRDLELQRKAIVTHVGRDDPNSAMELMWRFVNLAPSVFARSDDGSGRLIDVFHAAVNDLGELAVAANSPPVELADQIFNVLIDNGYGQYDYLISSMTPALGNKGLERLKKRMVELSKKPTPKPDPEDREIIGWGSGGPSYADEYAEIRRTSTVELALLEIADAQGDVDAFIEQKSETAKTTPAVATEIAGRLLAAGRLDEALEAIDVVDEDRRGWIPFEWENMRVRVLEALGRIEDAKQFQWECFERSLDSDHLRSFLKQLPDFDDIEVEERAIRHALQYPNIHQSLGFLISWPSLDKAAELVETRAKELDGNHYELLTPAADTLEARHPLASTLLRRALIDFALEKARSKRYQYAARHLQDCESLSGLIDDFGSFETHEVYIHRLKTQHNRKSMFWNIFEG